MPTRIQIRLRSYEAALNPITKFIKEVEADGFTLPLLPHQVDILFTELTPSEEDSLVLQNVKSALLSSAKSPERFGNILTTSNLALLAAALHPAYSKLSFISVDLRLQVGSHISIRPLSLFAVAG